MRFYFSGVGRPAAGQTHSAEFRMLRRAGVRHILADQFQLGALGDYRSGVALDCGSYYAYKKLAVLRLGDYLEVARTRGPFDFTVALDAVGNPALSHARWQEIKRLGAHHELNMIPVWQWGAPREHLHRYMDESETVGIGGLVNLMREKDEEMRRELIALCEEFPRRTHVFALNWLRCFNDLADLVHSADSSKWLDAARKGTVIFRHTRTGHLAQMPMRMALQAGVIDRELSREERCILSAKNMDDFCNRGGNSPAPTPRTPPAQPTTRRQHTPA